MWPFFPTFCRHLLWSLEILYYPPFVLATLVIIGSIVASVLIQRPFAKEVWKQRYSVVFVQFLCFPAVIAVAATGRVDGPEPNDWGLRAADLLSLISLGLGIYWIWIMKGLPWYATSVTLLQLWLLAAANFIAGMALTGRWL